jgi:hypothetical protein
MSKRSHCSRMLGRAHFSISSRRAATGPIACTFFKPVQAHGQFADLLMQRCQLAFAVVVHRFAPLEQLGQPLPDRRLPLAHQHRMHLMLARQLSHGLDSHHRVQAHAGLERATILFAFSLHRSALSHFEQTSTTIVSPLVQKPGSSAVRDIWQNLLRNPSGRSDAMQTC